MDGTRESSSSFLLFSVFFSYSPPRFSLLLLFFLSLSKSRWQCGPRGEQIEGGLSRPSMILYGFSGVLEFFPTFLPVLGTAQDSAPAQLMRAFVRVCVPFFLRKRHVNVNLVGYLIDTKPCL